MEAIDLGLKLGEMVLRGGMLKRPTVISGVKIVHGCGFVYLWKTSRWLNEFLAGGMRGARPLSCTAVPEALQELRERARLQSLQDASVEDASDGAAGTLDRTEALGFDAPAPAAASGYKGSKRKRLAAKALLPLTVEVTLTTPGFDPWKVRLLLESVQRAVAMEVTTDNLTALYLRVQADLAAGRKLRPRYGSGGGGAGGAASQVRRKKPRHYEDGSKEYSVGRRWVRKIPEQAAGGRPPFAGPSFRRFKVLKRRHTEDAAAEALRRAPTPAGLALEASLGPADSLGAEESLGAEDALGAEDSLGAEESLGAS